LEVLKQLAAESRRLELETFAASAATKTEQNEMRLIHSHGRTGMVLLQTSTRITSNIVQQYDLKNRIADQLDRLGQSCLSWSQRLRK
jgi:hypothetical protein